MIHKQRCTTMINCEVQIRQIPISILVEFRHVSTHNLNVLSGVTGLCKSTLSSRRVPPVQSARPLRNHFVAWKR